MGDAGMSTEMTRFRESAFSDHTAHEPAATGTSPSPSLSGTARSGPSESGPLSGLERAAFFAALRRKADQRIAAFG
jgi:hypothetical protein